MLGASAPGAVRVRGSEAQPRALEPVGNAINGALTDADAYMEFADNY